jgi:serine/threonine-protein kinase RsbW
MKLFFSLCLPPEGATVPVVRHLCGASLRNLGVEEDCVSDIELAVSEACSNVLKHADGDEQQYEVTVKVDSRRARITVSDTGGRFDVPGRGAMVPDGGAEGGRGLLLMRHLVDELHFVTEGRDRTTLRLEKDLVLEPHSVLGRLPEGARRRVS